MKADNAEFIICDACGRRHPRDITTVGKPFRCGCGSVVFVSQHPPAEGDEYDLAGEQDEFEIVADDTPVTMRPAVAPTSVSSEVIRARMGAMPAKRRYDPAEAAAKSAAEFEKRLEPSLIRDVIIPTLLLIAGVLLSLFEMTHVGKNHAPSVSAAIPWVVGRAIGSIALICGAILLSMATFEVSLLGRFEDNFLKAAAVAIAPTAINGLCVYAMGETNGAILGTFATLGAYFVLFKFLMSLDVKDAAVCGMIAFILITALNYAIYRWQGGLQMVLI